MGYYTSGFHGLGLVKPGLNNPTSLDRGPGGIADALVLKTGVRKDVRVQIPRAPKAQPDTLRTEMTR